MSTKPQKAIYQKLLSNLEYVIPKTKDKFLTTTVIIFFSKNQIRCTYFKLLCQVVAKGQTLKQTHSQNLLFILSMYGLLLLPGIKG